MNRKELKELFQIECDQLDLLMQVFSDGPLTSKIAIVAQGPGATEVTRELPMVGSSGTLMWNFLRRDDLNRSNVYTTNVVKRQISTDKRSKNKVGVAELAKWIGLLKWELSQLPNLEIIFACGDFALQALTGEKGITNWRGSVLHRTMFDRDITIVCAFNPAHILRELKMEPVFLMDCRKLGQVSRGVYKPHEIDEIINPSYSDVIEYINLLIEQNELTCLDIETMSMETACIGIGNSTHEAMCINLRDHRANRFTLEQELQIHAHIQKLVCSVPIVAQNGAFDSYFLWYKNHIPVPIYHDTMLAHHTLYPQLPHSLAFLVAQYTNHPYYKDEGKFWKEGGDIDQFWRYNCKDVSLTLACQRQLDKELKKQGLSDFFYNHVMRLQPHLIRSTVEGTAVDLKLKDKLIIDTERDISKKLEKFHKLVQDISGQPDYVPNPLSWQHLQELFFDELGLKGRGKSTNKANREYMLKQPETSADAREILTAVNSYKTDHKFYSTYATCEIDEDDRFRCQWNQTATQRAPGRLSSSETIWGTGQNIQNQPPRARGMYVADKGCVFIYFDLSQAEARVVAVRADIKKWKEDFERARVDNSYDCHRSLAADMFKIPYDETPTNDYDKKKQPTIRYKSKRCRHGLNYRMEIWKLSEVTGLPYHEARKIYYMYHKVTPELRYWWKEQERVFRKDRVIFNALGRRHKVIQRIDQDVLSSIIAFYPQSTIGDKVSRVWYKSVEDHDWPDKTTVIRMNHHDALIGVSTPKSAKSALAIMKKHAEEPLLIEDVYKNKVEELIIPAECKISVPDEHKLHRWSNLKTVEI